MNKGRDLKKLVGANMSEAEHKHQQVAAKVLLAIIVEVLLILVCSRQVTWLKFESMSVQIPHWLDSWSFGIINASWWRTNNQSSTIL